MIVDKYGRVAGSIDLAALTDMYEQATDDELKAHFRQVAAENGASLLGEPEPEPEPEPAPAPPDADLDDLRAQAEAVGVKVDKRWGADRLRSEIDAAQQTESEDEG